jgi:hypothetical protein
MIIPDVNLLLYAYNEDAPWHAPARAWWESVLSGTECVGLPWVVGLGYLRLATNSRVLRDPWTPLEALGHIGSWLERPNVQLVQPGPRHLELLAHFAAEGLLSSELTTDAHIAALGVENHAIVYSNDADFSRFPGLRLRNPLKG